MIGLGQIPTIGNAHRTHEMRLFQEVADVDEKEAEQGALHTDSLKLGAKEREEPSLLSAKGLSGRLSRFWSDLKAKKTDSKGPEDDCPIAKARAQSSTGENAPMGWLTFDHLAGSQQNGAPAYETHGQAQVNPPSKESRVLSFLQADPDDSDYMFNEEWFLSPCG